MTCFAASRVRFYGMLYLAAQRETHANLRSRSGRSADIYLLCAALCAASIAASGGTFALITNDVRRLRDRCIALGITNLEMIEYSFRWTVPEGIAFYSAHFKLELIDRLWSRAIRRMGRLIDIDTVLWKPLDLPNFDGDGLIAYDITSIEITPHYELPRVRNDLEMVAGRALREARWYGGEFLMGSPARLRVNRRRNPKVLGKLLELVGGPTHTSETRRSALLRSTWLLKPVCH